MFNKLILLISTLMLLYESIFAQTSCPSNIEMTSPSQKTSAEYMTRLLTIIEDQNVELKQVHGNLRSRLANLEKILAEKIENTVVLEQKLKGDVEFHWEIHKFDIRKYYYESPAFQAFGHTLCLLFNKAERSGNYEIFLQMKSRYPDRLGSKFFIGNSEHNKEWSSGGMDTYPAPDGGWGWGSSQIVTKADLTNTRFLTENGTLQIKAIVYYMKM